MTDVSFDQALDFSRGTAATYYDANGTLQTAGPDEPRFTHDPETGEPQGLLIEEQRTNLLLWSEDFTQGVWSKTNVTVSASSTVSPNGPAFELTDTTGEGECMLSQSVLVPDGATLTCYFVVKDLTDNRAFQSRIAFSGTSVTKIDPATGEVLTMSGSGQVQALSDGWYLVAVSRTNSSGATGNMSVRAQLLEKDGIPYSPGDGSGVLLAPISQAEQASTPSSYIKTEDAQVTRAADQVSRELGSEFNSQSFTVFGDFSRLEGGVQNPGVLSIDQNDGSIAHSLYIYMGAGGGFYVAIRDSGTLASGVVGSGRPSKIAVSVSPTELTWATGGQSGVLPISDPLPDLSGAHLRIGDHTLGAINPHTVQAKHVQVFPRSLSESELLALTTPEAN